MPRTNSIIRPDLGVLAYEYSLSAATQGFIGHQVLPAFNTALQSAQYPVIPAEAILETADTQRAPRTAYARGDWEFDFKDFNCKENGWEEPLDDTEAALFARYFDAETVAVQRATLMVLRSQERRVAARVMDTKTFKNTAVAHAWNSYADADPLADVNRAKDYFRYSVGLKPNALIMDEDVLKHISMCDAVMERIKYTSPNAIRGELTMEQLKAYFSLPNIIVAGAVYNKAAKRRPKEIAAIWPTDMIMLACLSSGGQNLKEPCLGRTFLWEEDSPGMLTTEQYREEQTRSDIYRVRQNTDECIQFTGAGYILTGVTEEKNSELP
ncbi:hypothetical protein [uncultured Desulfovibrio sp.]|uniref:hypothetical protein n=1 Tax=uncultured Desulfovibrio sp. TaxID=167968 RepID=UPI00258A844B|nr:hypothetical protein [uncultured Desulfovibrio sp.]